MTSSGKGVLKKENFNSTNCPMPLNNLTAFRKCHYSRFHRQTCKHYSIELSNHCCKVLFQAGLTIKPTPRSKHEFRKPSLDATYHYKNIPTVGRSELLGSSYLDQELEELEQRLRQKSRERRNAQYLVEEVPKTFVKISKRWDVQIWPCLIHIISTHVELHYLSQTALA